MQPKIIDQFSDSSFRKLAQLIRRFPEAQDQIKTAEMDPEANALRSNSSFAARACALRMRKRWAADLNARPRNSTCARTRRAGRNARSVSTAAVA